MGSEPLLGGEQILVLVVMGIAIIIGLISRPKQDDQGEH